MQAVELMEGYVSKLKAADKDLKRLERASKKLSEKQVEADDERERLENSIAEHRRKVAALHGENQDLQLTYIQAVYQQNAHAQREAQTRRQEIDAELQRHAEAIEELSKSLDELPDFAKEAATVAAEIDALQFGNGFLFGNNLRDALVRDEAALKSRQSAARSNLPSFSEATRREVDPAYREEQERKQRTDENEARRVRAVMEENERKASRVTGLRRQ